MVKAGSRGGFSPPMRASRFIWHEAPHTESMVVFWRGDPFYFLIFFVTPRIPYSPLAFAIVDHSAPHIKKSSM